LEGGIGAGGDNVLSWRWLLRRLLDLNPLLSLQVSLIDAFVLRDDAIVEDSWVREEVDAVDGFELKMA
jgi:hypothetical protein